MCKGSHNNVITTEKIPDSKLKIKKKTKELFNKITSHFKFIILKHFNRNEKDILKDGVPNYIYFLMLNFEGKNIFIYKIIENKQTKYTKMIIK